MRLDFRDYVAAAHRVAGSFAASTETLGALSEQLAEESRVRIESWHPDPYVHGFTLGEGYALGRMSALLAYQANAMRMAEMSDGERSEG